MLDYNKKISNFKLNIILINKNKDSENSKSRRLKKPLSFENENNVAEMGRTFTKKLFLGRS